MNEKRILDLLSQVNDEFIEEASPIAEKKKRKKMKNWMKWCAIAASLCLIVSGVVFGQNVQ